MPSRRSAALPRLQRRAPTSAKAEQRVRDIVRAGREVFSERGYERATTTEIAQRLGISPATVGSHIKNLYRKLAVHSRVQVVRVAQERGLL